MPVKLSMQNKQNMIGLSCILLLKHIAIYSDHNFCVDKMTKKSNVDQMTTWGEEKEI